MADEIIIKVITQEAEARLSGGRPTTGGEGKPTTTSKKKPKEEGAFKALGEITSMKTMLGKIGVAAGAIGIIITILNDVLWTFKPVINIIKQIFKLIGVLFQPISEMFMLLLRPVLAMLKPFITMFKTMMAPFMKIANNLGAIAMKQVATGDISGAMETSMNMVSVVLGPFIVATTGIVIEMGIRAITSVIAVLAGIIFGENVKKKIIGAGDTIATEVRKVTVNVLNEMLEGAKEVEKNVIAKNKELIETKTGGDVAPQTEIAPTTTASKSELPPPPLEYRTGGLFAPKFPVPKVPEGIFISKEEFEAKFITPYKQCMMEDPDSVVNTGSKALTMFKNSALDKLISDPDSVTNTATLGFTTLKGITTLGFTTMNTDANNAMITAPNSVTNTFGLGLNKMKDTGEMFLSAMTSMAKEGASELSKLRRARKEAEKNAKDSKETKTLLSSNR